VPQSVSPIEIVRIPMPFGWVSAATCRDELCGIELWPSGPQDEWVPVPGVGRAAPILEQMNRYLDEPRTTFRLALKCAGTLFQRRVWDALAGIPPGRVETYGCLARTLGSGPRAVAAACKANPFPIVIPCHRVVASRGLGGYCGHSDGPWLEIKRWLLTHEGYFPTVADARKH